MKKKAAAFLLFFFTIQVLVSQSSSTSIFGFIKNTSFVGVKDVHIFNLNTKIGSVTDQDGLFTIAVSKGDSLLISSIQYQNEIITITAKIIQEKKAHVYLLDITNQLEEVVLKKKLTGVLGIDLKGTPKDTVGDLMTKLVTQIKDISAKDLEETPIDKDERHLQKSTNAQFLTDPISKVSGLPTGTTIPDRSSIEKKALRKRLDYKKWFPSLIKLELGEDFFFTQLKIPRDRFYHFLEYCNPLNIEELYKQHKLLEVITILRKESISYLKLIESNK
ncbi:MAG: carboxypeptidase-like regulatory domain-containing protein [Polaribacter sp.]|nr:carboxypeptidase-like regulatory domain-containing protein [Polaribacter sp.]